MTEPLNFAEDCQNQSVVNIDCFGAIPDLLDNSQAIQEAINYCAANNYSKVVITGKKQYTISSPIVIKSNVHLEMDPTVTLIVKGNFQVFELQKNTSISGGSIEIVDNSFNSSVLYLSGAQQIEIPNHTSISNINIINRTTTYQGIAIHLSCKKAWDFISFFQAYSIQITNFNTAIYLKTEKLADINNPCWINANSFHSIFIDGCQYGIEIIGNSALPYEISGNTFTGIQVQCRKQTKKVIRCSGAYNMFEGVIWDVFRMDAPPLVIEFSSISHHNYLFSNQVSTSILDRGLYNRCTSPHEESLPIYPPLALGKAHLVGNQDDILVNANVRYAVRQLSGKAPYGGHINNCFNLLDEQSVNYVDVPSTQPIVIELDFSKKPINMLNCIGIYFGWNESPSRILIEYQQSLNGPWEVAKDLQFNVGDTVISEVRSAMLYKVKLTLSGYTQDHKRFRINRIFAKSSLQHGSSWLPTTGGTLYGDLEFQKGNAVTLTSPNGTKWRLSINDQGQISTSKL
ncbi:hypothetical protein RGU76_00980 [Bacillus pseudomycoides]|uniref:hypothetical protein n=1 Tax=Bacillus TaxID=1386 RepID=UPI0022491240|nr:MULTISPECIES: hypothetical protein [Bacillus]MCX2826152.1 hypothetical protein [Bacillus sp. DHT2]MDR4913730.1 hypothetical protein [Bacillus pseudomycoides]